MAWLLVVLVLAAIAAAVWWVRFQAVPPTRGTFVLPGLSAPVEITRDRFGVPHVRGRNMADVCAALGYCHAQDRLFQLELNRRVASGRLAEMVGPLALDADRFLRRIGLRRAAEAELAQCFPEERALLEAYARGVNAAAEALSDRRPLEFRILGITWEPWTPLDTLAWGKVMALNLATNSEAEAYRGRLIEKVGVERAPNFEPSYPAGHTVSIPPGAVAKESMQELTRLYDAARSFLPLGQSGASNNWVLAGSRTASGAPLLCNDPHLVLTAPSIWYEAHLHAQAEGAKEPELDVFGVTLPGTPAVILGHNRHVAWGFTNSGADVQDLYLEKFIGRDAVEFRGENEPVRVIREVIRVKGGSDVVEEVRITRHGPVMAGGPGKPGPAVALRWTALEPSHGPWALSLMNRAKSAAELREALRHWSDPSQNAVFADRENIGFVMIGRVPIRAKGTGLTPVPGWTGEYEWTGYVPFEELPQAWNPASGQIVTANNAIVDRDFPHHITWDWLAGHRAGRITERLNALPKVTPEDCARIQVDVYCTPGKAFAQACANLKPRGPLQDRALFELAAWDGNATAESAGAAVYEAMIMAVAKRALEPVLGHELLQTLLGKSEFPLAPAGLMTGRYTSFLLEKVLARDTRIWDGLEPKPSWDEVLQAGLADAVELLRQRLGDDASQWSWGKLHRLRIKHALSGAPVIGKFFDGPSAPIGGDCDTPLQTAVLPTGTFGADGWAPSWRHIVPLEDIEHAQTVLPTGQSGIPRTKHYADQFPLWMHGELKPTFTNAGALREHTEATMHLVPGEK
ncbi:MAG: penicillin acylase family protein [Deltaproteobacteria bacterium]|nr:penicillin acylase family protein [Deltaproteobacteria bacterium]